MKKTLHEKIRSYFQRLVDSGKFSSAFELAKHLGLPPTKASKLYNFLKGKEPLYGTVMEWIDTIGGTVLFPDKKPVNKDVYFVSIKQTPAGEHANLPNHDDYIAVPMVGEVGAGMGYLPEEQIKSWFLVHKHLPGVRYKRNLIAVEIGKQSISMVPTLHPGNIVLIDRDDRDVTKSGHTMLIKDPDGSGMIKRVAVENLDNGDFSITYYSDNTIASPPMRYSLQRNFLGDWERSIVGRVIWACADITKK